MLLFYVFSCSVVSDCLQPHDCSPPGSTVHGDSPGNNTGVGCHALLQGIFQTQGSNPSLLHCRQILYQLSHQQSPRLLEGVAYPFSRGSFWPRNWTWVSCIAGRFFTSWATRVMLLVVFNWLSLLQIILLWDLYWWSCLSLEHCWFYGREWLFSNTVITHWT